MFKHEDKLNHFAGSYTAYMLLFLFFSVFIPWFISLAAAAFVVFFGGFMLEIIQHRNEIDTFDVWDLAADVAGIVASAASIFALVEVLRLVR